MTNNNNKAICIDTSINNHTHTAISNDFEMKQTLLMFQLDSAGDYFNKAEQKYTNSWFLSMNIILKNWALH